MHKSIQTIAWAVMLLAFVTFITLLIGTPVGVRQYLRSANRPLQVVLQPRSGNVTFQSKGRGDPALISDQREVLPRSRIALVSDDAEALLLFYRPEQPDIPVSTLQLYGETDVVFVSARTARFERWSTQPHQVDLEINTGERLRVSVGGDGRASILHLQTPQGALDLESGSYILAVDAERTEIEVNRGRALVPEPRADNIFVLTDLQRTTLTEEGLSEVVSRGGRRDLLRNGDFDQALSPHWDTYIRAKQLGDQSDGEIEQTNGERGIVAFERVGVGHIETGISQELDESVSDATSLFVTALLKVNQQSLPFCGADGTECPVMLRITYVDAQGGTHEWLQGFYSLVGGGYTNVCAVCEGNPTHIEVPQGAWYTYTSPNLIQELRERGIEPATILNVDVYASGHSFFSEVDEVTLLLER